MSLNNFSSNGTKFKRHPAKRVLIEDLKIAQWNEDLKTIATRYGELKRVRVCGANIQRNEKFDINSEDNFVTESNQSNSRISINVDDGTGRLWATIWGIDQDDYLHILPGDFLDIVGIVRSYRNEISITAEYIKKINDPNQEVYHILEVLKKRKFDPQFEITAENSTKTFDDFDFELSPNSSNMDDKEINFTSQDTKTEKVNLNKSKSSQLSSFNSNSDIFEGEDQKDIIVSFISDNDEGDGVSIQTVAEKFSIEKNQLKEILEQLCQDVKIYKSQPGHYSSY